MKKIIALFIVVCGVLLYSCEEHALTQIGFNSSISKNSNGITIMHVKSGPELIHLDGIVIVNEGEVKVELERPGGEVIYTMNVQSPDSLWVNKIFDAQKGYWKLKYSSTHGTGAIDLHLRY